MLLARRSPGATSAASASAKLWPPILATWGAGAASGTHAHHALHLALCRDGSLRVRSDRAGQTAAGVLTAPDAPHAIDARGAEVLLVFVEPESDLGLRLVAELDGPLRLFSPGERDAMCATLAGELSHPRVAAWIGPTVAQLSGSPMPIRRIHPRVRKVLRALHAEQADVSLAALADVAGLSPGRFMHAFTESLGIPIRPYLLWLKLQRAASAIAQGAPLARAAAEAGFTDAAHMTRTFRRMLGTTPSEIRRRSQLVQDPEG
jgi:AraC-like DNA-binding protein